VNDAHRELRASTTISFAATMAVVGIALVATLLPGPAVSPWPRFWGTTFFALLLWPIGLTICARLAGRRTQLVCAGLILALTAAQHAGVGRIALPELTSWSVSLTAPGDAIRREITLPAAHEAAWQRAWSRASQVAVAICTEQAIDPAADVHLRVNDGSETPLALLRRSGRSNERGWYLAPVTRPEVDAERPLAVELRRAGSTGSPARVCGGQDDPTRPGWGGSARLRSGIWSTQDLADLPIPAIHGHPAPSRYYVELRFFSADGLPHVGIWY